MDAATRDLVRRRAGNRCEYCHLPQQAVDATFHVDPETNEIITLFNPREDVWDDDFAFRGAEVIGLTAAGRATVRLLQMNIKHRLEFRHWLIEDGNL